ncbi:MAG: hypothetical protein QOI28_270 [Mycobacterium sp.]|nr:hypothetical protein [Mycobacterium sp.]
MTPSSVAGSARVRLGHSDLTVRPVGLGCMGMSQFYGAADDSQSIDTIRAALDLGVNFLDTSDVYGAADIRWGVTIRGFGHNEELIGTALAGRRDDVVLATKFAAKIDDDRTGIMIDGRPDYVRAACEDSLRRLRTDVIDLYYYHRLDRSVPIEDDAAFVQGDIRATNPRFSGENLRSNLQPVDSLVALAQEKGCRAGQLALAWLLAQPLDVVPIPGTRRAEYVQENVEATNVAISIDEIAYLSEVFARNRIVGEQYAAVHAQTVEK